MDGTILRQLTPDAIAERAHLYEPSSVVYWQSGPGRGDTLRRFVGDNPDTQAEIYYSIAEQVGPISVEILDHTGRTVQELDAPNELGLNRVTWNLRRAAQGNRRFAPRVEPGRYQVVLSAGDLTLSRTLVVESDPNAPDAQLWGEEYEEWQEVGRMMEEEEGDEGPSGRID
jgi:hypothetical protein